MIDRFIEVLIEEINKYYTCYYEEAPNNTKFPYLIMPTLNVTPLDSGYLAVFDLEIYINEISDVSVETIIDTIRDKLDGFSFCEKGLGFHIGLDNHLIVKSNEQDLSMRRITFSARLFR